MSKMRFYTALLLVLILGLDTINSVYASLTNTFKNARLEQCSTTFQDEKNQRFCTKNVLECFKGVEVSMADNEVHMKATLLPSYVKCAKHQGMQVAKAVAKACIASNYHPKVCGDRYIVDEAIREMTTVVDQEDNKYSPQIELSSFGEIVFKIIPKVMELVPRVEIILKSFNIHWSNQESQMYCSKDQFCDEESPYIPEEDIEAEKELDDNYEIEVIDTSPKEPPTKCPEEDFIEPAIGEGKESKFLSFIKTSISEASYFLVHDFTQEDNYDMFPKQLASLLTDCQLTRLNCCVLPTTDYITDPKDITSFNTKLFTHKIFSVLKPELRNAFIQAAINFKISEKCEIYEIKDRLADDCVDYLHKKKQVFG